MSATIVGPRQIYSEQTHASKYRLPGESFRDAMSRVAGALDDGKDHYHSFREVLLDMRFLPAGRVQSAMGAPKAVTPYNCFVGGTIPDSFVDRDNPENSSIMDRAREGAQTMRMGGGLGNDFSTLRPSGALIEKIQSSSTGPLKFMGIFNSVGDATSSTGERRGAQMGILRIDHPDIVLFINSKHDNTTLRRFNISVAITDEFMEHLASQKPFPLRFGGKVYKHVDPVELWEMLMRSTYDWAEPGVVFIDRINEFNNLWYAERITATNPCFTGDTLVWTAKGHRSFADLARSGEDVSVLSQRDDGRLVYRMMRRPRLTRRKARLVEVTLASTSVGRHKSEITTTRCTPGHEFYLPDGSVVAASDLRSGMSLESAYRYKWDRRYNGIRNTKSFWREPHLPFEDVVGLGRDFHVHHKDECKRNNDPDNLELLGQFEHDGLKARGNKNCNWDHAVTVERVAELRDEGLSGPDIQRALGASRSVVKNRLRVAESRITNHKVVSVRELEIEEDVYCGTVDETHKFFIALGKNHGVLVANCSEQPLPPNGACLLGSYNLVKYIRVHTDGSRYFDFDQFSTDIPHVTRAMDNIVDRAIYPLVAQELEAKNKRRMGMGVTGMANAIEACGHLYGTPGFVEMEHRILAHLTRETYLASSDLAAEKGSFPLFDSEKFRQGKFFATLDSDVQERILLKGLRNSHLISYAPTGTISMCADNVSSSIEPAYQWRAERPVELPGMVVNMLQYDYGFREFHTRGRRAANGEVSAREHVDVLVAAQSHCDSAVSKTVNCDGSMPWEDFQGIYLDAYERGAKGCTTFNKDGKRFGLFKQEVEADDIPFPERGIGEVNHGHADSESCTFDPATGRRTCE